MRYDVKVSEWQNDGQAALIFWHLEYSDFDRLLDMSLKAGYTLTVTKSEDE